MRKMMSRKDGKGVDKYENENGGKVVDLKPHHFSNKERYNWFEILQLYTKNFLNEEE